MANRRMIYQDFFEDDYFGMADPLIRLTWIGLITAVADDQGRILDNSSLIKARVFVYDRTINEVMIDNWLNKLNNDGKILRYQVEGKRLIQIVNWWSYQTPAWANYSKYPSPDGWVDRVRCHVSGNRQGGEVETMNWDKQGGFEGTIKELRSKQGSYQASGIDDIKLREDKLSTQTDLFDACKSAYETKKGLLVTDGRAFTEMINEFEQKGVTVNDYISAIDAMDADQKYKGSKPTSYKKWAIGYA